MIVLATHTKKLLDAAIKQPVHGILLSGPEGSGKYYTAEYLASRLLGLSADKLAVYPYFRAVTPDKGTVSIDQIRELQKFLQLKTTGTATIRRIAIIQDAHTMTTEAQNALLKSLEEPPADTAIILTAPRTLQLKETIYSRVRSIPVLPPTKAQLLKAFANEASDSKMTKLYLMSGGYTGLFAALLHDDDHPLANAIQQAKLLLNSSAYARLLRVDELSQQKEFLPTLLQAFKIIATTALEQAAAKNNPAQTKKWHAVLTSCSAAEASLQHNPNSKLLLSDLFLSI